MKRGNMRPFKFCHTKYTEGDVLLKLIRENEEPNYVGKIVLGHSFINFTVQEEAKIIEIGDIKCEKNNVGIGSLMMKKLITHANRKKITIKGWISKVDKDHLDRLIHFYEKFKFTIEFVNDGLKIADIIKTIDKK